jgi:hypothetical protein
MTARKPGRKSALDTHAEQIAEVIRHIRNGHKHKRACAAAGMNFQTFENLCSKGRKPDADDRHRALAEAADTAAEAGLVNRVAMIEMHGFDDWRALAWLVARQDPERYGAVRTVRLGGDPDGVPVKTETASSIDFTGWEPSRIAAYIELVEGSGEVELEDE